jgi:hypothetical protein
MNPEAQRIAIASACGWRIDDELEDGELMGYIVDTDNIEVWDIVPDYCNDLNAMHEAEQVLTNIQRERYRTELVYRYAGGDIFATAAQRAEAFLRTLNLWKE